MTGEKCPVCKGEMHHPKSVNFEGKNIQVCSDECASEFKKHPSKFASGTFGTSGSAHSGGSKVGSGAGGDSGGHAAKSSPSSSPKMR